jgi:microsomal dipeptidase-like Zn-dependent dipeptidase
VIASCCAGDPGASLDRCVDGLKEMAVIVGVDHISIGTDRFDPRGCVED